jgi:uncharacterized membrane protein
MTASNPGGQRTTATGAEGGATSSSEPGAAGLEQTIARLLTAGTYASIALLVAGLLLMAADGMAPLAGGPPFDIGRLIPDIAAVRPEGFLWLGLLVVIATPATRVVASLVGYGRRGERGMAIVSGLILVVIAASVWLAKSLEG